ncbi:MAG: GNAT family N-acetyltransferase, partial [Cyanobacteria bacterium]|nr:GNAT family N-acetyltransferase [Cyanobacteriota bacterium]
MPSPTNLAIRPIQPQDDPFLEAIVTNVLGEHGCSGPGWASADVELKTMFHTYSQPGSQYYVIETSDTHKVCGGGGFSQLKGSNPEDKICELQKLYFTPECRGKGMGRKLLTLLIEKATDAGYKTMYLESITQL